MSEFRRRYCIFGCDALVTYGVPFHRFPNPEKRPDLFAAWIAAAGSKVTESDHTKVFKNKRICDHHFDSTFKTTGGRLIWSAIPTVNLNCVQQTISTFVETDHSYCGPRRESAMPDSARSLIDVTNLPSPSRSEPSSDVDCTESPAPSGSTGLMSSEKCHVRTPILIQIDEGKTFEYLQRKAESQCARKTRQMQNEIRRLRQQVKTLKLRLKQVENKSANRDFERLSCKMSESAKLFTRMQCIEGQKKKKGHRFTQEEKILSLSIFKKSPKAYNFMCKHFTLPSKKLLKPLLVQKAL